MSVPFKGKVNVDIRDSVEDWAPFAPPQAPEGAPNVVYIVLDDVGLRRPTLDDVFLALTGHGVEHADSSLTVAQTQGVPR